METTERARYLFYMFNDSSFCEWCGVHEPGTRYLYQTRVKSPSDFQFWTAYAVLCEDCTFGED